MSPSIPSIQSPWPSKDIQEACFVQYFIQELAQWFDTCDASDKHFARVVPGRATACPALYYAVLSASARHISRRQCLGDGNVLFSGKKLPPIKDEIALEYQSLCISHLVSSYGSIDEVLLDEDLLAATVILRFYEEVDAPLAGIDNETYLRGTQILVSAQATTAVEKEGLQRAAFWVAFRQEFHKALLKQRAFSFNLDCCRSVTYGSFSTADDSTWANRMVLHCADILGYCYDNERRHHDFDAYDALLEYNHTWQVLAPPVFSPIFSKEPDRPKGEVFPELWYLDDCTVTAIQHLHLARILLAAFDPRVPRLGLDRKSAVARREAEIKTNLFRLCGIALSNRTAPALITACMGVKMSGDRVTDRLEQNALLDVLVRTEKIHALSTTDAQERLKQAWEWNEQ